jgi:hypothetical protein
MSKNSLALKLKLEEAKQEKKKIDENEEEVSEDSDEDEEDEIAIIEPEHLTKFVASVSSRLLMFSRCKSSQSTWRIL